MSVIDSLFNDPPQGWPPRADIPAQPGIYAIFLKESEKLPFEFIEYYNSIKKKGNYRLAYIG